jgi:hypothetical protein
LDILIGEHPGLLHVDELVRLYGGGSIEQRHAESVVADAVAELLASGLVHRLDRFRAGQPDGSTSAGAGVMNTVSSVAVRHVRRSRLRFGGLQQDQRVDADLVGDAFQALERQVALAAFNATHVGAVDAELVGEGFLGDTALLAVGSEVPADGLLEFAFHVADRSGPLLDGLQTYE